MPESNTPTPTTSPLRHRRRKRVLLVLGALLLGLAVVFHNPLFHGNFGVVMPGEVYRSAQPHGNLDGIVETYRVASILNLRGGTPGDRFYSREVALTRARGVDFYDFPMSATKTPTRRQLLILIDLFERCRYPLLIHCKSGSDRTGLASGLYLLARAGRTPAEALRAFSLYYGHVPLLGTGRLHEPFVEYDRWLKERGLEHTPGRLRVWVEREYEADDPPGVVPTLPAGPRFSYAGRFRR